MQRLDAPCSAASTTEQPAIVALHCSASSPRQWASYAARLAGRVLLEAPALIGYDDTSDWSPQDAIGLVEEAERLEPVLNSHHEAVHLVGHSYGATVALTIARLWPQRVRSLTLYEPIPFALLRHHTDGGPWTEIQRLAREVALSVRIGQPHRAAERFIDYWGGTSSWAGMPERRRASVSLRMAKVCREFDALFDDPTPAHALSLLEMPVHVLCGSDSPPPARRTSEIVASLCPRAELRYLPGLGHMGPVDQADIVMPFLPLASAHGARADTPVSGP